MNKRLKITYIDMNGNLKFVIKDWLQSTCSSINQWYLPNGYWEKIIKIEVLAEEEEI